MLINELNRRMKKLLLVFPYEGNQNVPDGIINDNTKEINQFVSVVSYFLYKYMKKTFDITIADLSKIGKEYKHSNFSLPYNDYILIVDTCWVNNTVKQQLVQYLKKFAKYIITYVEHKNLQFIGQHLLFYILDGNISWCADHHMLLPQKKQKITIIIDHENQYKYNQITDFNTKSPKDILYTLGKDKKFFALHDKTYDIIQNLLDFKNKRKNMGLDDIIIKKICHKGCIEINKWEDVELMTSNVPFDQVYKEFNEAHIFVTTHKESLGLCTIEACMAGCLILTYENKIDYHITKALINTIPHMKYNKSNSVDWDSVINNIDIEKSRNGALNYTWEKISATISDKILQLK